MQGYIPELRKRDLDCQTSFYGLQATDLRLPNDLHSAGKTLTLIENLKEVEDIDTLSPVYTTLPQNCLALLHDLAGINCTSL
jgi:hypothetical protein